MSERFFVESLDHPIVEIEGAEAKHIARVMRLGPGDKAILFDGTNRECEATIESVSKTFVRLRCNDINEVNRESTTRVIVAAAIPKGDRLKFMIEKLTELGTFAFVPLNCERSSVVPRENTLARMRRYVIEASKQCGRNRLLDIHEPVKALQFLHSSVYGEKQTGEKQTVQGCRRLICVPESQDYFAVENAADPKDHIFMVGPEGGWAPTELEAATHNGWERISLGNIVLRLETAAIACCARTCRAQ